jgi:hypothetical protein
MLKMKEFYMDKVDVGTLKKYLHYNKDTGIFTWIFHDKKPEIVGRVAGCREKRIGYEVIRIEGVTYKSHRLAWLYVHGEWPQLIDHINGIKHDNRLENLRSVDDRTNCQNKEWHRAGRLVGAHFHTVHQRWSANIVIKGKLRHLGLFDSEQEAHEAYMWALNNQELVKSKMEEKIKSGLPVGVAYKEKDRLYEVKICHNKQKIYCGSFRNIEDAIKRADEARPIIKSGKPYDYKQQHPLTTPTA